MITKLGITIENFKVEHRRNFQFSNNILLVNHLFNLNFYYLIKLIIDYFVPIICENDTVSVITIVKRGKSSKLCYIYIFPYLKNFENIKTLYLYVIYENV